MTPSDDLVRLEAVTRVFDDGAVVAVREVDLSVMPGDCLAILGRSGSGKSSIVNMLSGIDAPHRGPRPLAGRGGDVPAALGGPSAA